MLNAPQSSRLENSLQKMSSKDPLKQRNRFVDKKKKKQRNRLKHIK